MFNQFQSFSLSLIFQFQAPTSQYKLIELFYLNIFATLNSFIMSLLYFPGFVRIKQIYAR